MAKPKTKPLPVRPVQKDSFYQGRNAPKVTIRPKSSQRSQSVDPKRRASPPEQISVVPKSVLTKLKNQHEKNISDADFLEQRKQRIEALRSQRNDNMPPNSAPQQSPHNFSQPSSQQHSFQNLASLELDGQDSMSAQHFPSPSNPANIQQAAYISQPYDNTLKSDTLYPHPYDNSTSHLVHEQPPSQARETYSHQDQRRDTPSTPPTSSYTPVAPTQTPEYRRGGLHDLLSDKTESEIEAEKRKQREYFEFLKRERDEALERKKRQKEQEKRDRFGDVPVDSFQTPSVSYASQRRASEPTPFIPPTPDTSSGGLRRESAFERERGEEEREVFVGVFGSAEDEQRKRAEKDKAHQNELRRQIEEQRRKKEEQRRQLEHEEQFEQRRLERESEQLRQKYDMEMAAEEEKGKKEDAPVGRKSQEEVQNDRVKEREKMQALAAEAFMKRKQEEEDRKRKEWERKYGGRSAQPTTPSVFDDAPLPTQQHALHSTPHLTQSDSPNLPVQSSQFPTEPWQPQLAIQPLSTEDVADLGQTGLSEASMASVESAMSGESLSDEKTAAILQEVMGLKDPQERNRLMTLLGINPASITAPVAARKTSEPPLPTAPFSETTHRPLSKSKRQRLGSSRGEQRLKPAPHSPSPQPLPGFTLHDDRPDEELNAELDPLSMSLVTRSVFVESPFVPPDTPLDQSIYIRPTPTHTPPPEQVDSPPKSSKPSKIPRLSPKGYRQLPSTPPRGEMGLDSSTWQTEDEPSLREDTPKPVKKKPATTPKAQQEQAKPKIRPPVKSPSRTAPKTKSTPKRGKVAVVPPSPDTMRVLTDLAGTVQIIDNSQPHNLDSVTPPQSPTIQSPLGMSHRSRESGVNDESADSYAMDVNREYMQDSFESTLTSLGGTLDAQPGFVPGKSSKTPLKSSPQKPPPKQSMKDTSSEDTAGPPSSTRSDSTSGRRPGSRASLRPSTAGTRSTSQLGETQESIDMIGRDPEDILSHLTQTSHL